MNDTTKIDKLLPGGHNQAVESRTGLRYLTGFGNEHASEAIPGALPIGQNSPQQAPLGLYAEGISGTPFTAPRDRNQRSWFYRIKPSAAQGSFKRIDNSLMRAAPFNEVEAPANRLRWNPLPIPTKATDFIAGLTTLGGAGDVSVNLGYAVHYYLANASMQRYAMNADGEMLIVPQQGRLVARTEMGVMDLLPGEICLIPRGIKFAIDLPDGASRGYICENYGAAFRLPDLGPIGSNGLANPRDFLTPVAAYEDVDSPCELVCKYGGNLWSTTLDHSPLDVVAWHGNYAPCKYDLANFMAINTVSFDHPDPSINTVLTAPSEVPGTANVDFVIFPPRWMVAEHTFRPPWFHRNVMNEFMGLIHGVYDAKAEGFLPGGASLHNCMLPHGPDMATYEKASTSDLQPHFLGSTLAFMFETRYPLKPTAYAMQCPQLQPDYDACWNGFKKHFVKP